MSRSINRKRVISRSRLRGLSDRFYNIINKRDLSAFKSELSRINDPEILNSISKGGKSIVVMVIDSGDVDLLRELLKYKIDRKLLEEGLSYCNKNIDNVNEIEELLKAALYADSIGIRD
ncbi:MAG: hypothetical protein ARM1_0681 [Candidatus Micrarchaeota archaeon]|nr:MAG: hypothetical protein ARM1_0681 [Candidatus Micrarchaeota archaeon]